MQPHGLCYASYFSSLFVAFFAGGFVYTVLLCATDNLTGTRIFLSPN